MLQDAVLSILIILLSKRRVSREYLAERFSVSKRTISRYIDTLVGAGVPVTSTPGPGGGVAIADDFILDKLYLSEAETRRIKDALKRSACFYNDGVNLAISDKLDAVDRTRERDSFAIKQDDLYIDADIGQAEKLRAKIKTITQAIDNLRCIEITYSDSRGALSYRTIEPYTLVFKMGAWYVYAMCKLRGDFRLFKLTRIGDIRITSKRFAKTESKLTEKLELEFYNEVYVDLEFEFFNAPEVAEAVIDWLGADAISERGTKFIAKAELPLDDALYKKLLSFGSSIRVLAPKEIADKLLTDAEQMIKNYK